MTRVIARLDIKGQNLIKGVQFEGLRVIGSPVIHAERYARQGADELLLMDSVASLYGRNHLTPLLREITQEVFVPITVGGGIRSVADARNVLLEGADKIAVNTAAVKDPSLISRLADRFGSQSIVVSIDAKFVRPEYWEVYTECGRERSGLSVLEWSIRVFELGTGEILLTSVDRDGTLRGFDLHLVKQVSTAVSIPVVASGGAGATQDVISAFVDGYADAVAVGSILHNSSTDIQSIKLEMLHEGIEVCPHA